MTEKVHLTVGFKRRPPRRHPVIDILALIFAAALIGTVAGSGTVFAVVAAVVIAAYVFSWARISPPKRAGGSGVADQGAERSNETPPS